MHISSASSTYLPIVPLDQTSVAAIKQAKETWNNLSIKLAHASQSVVTSHPSLTAVKAPYQGMLIAGAPYRDTMSPHDMVIVHYKGKFQMFDEPVLVPPQRLADVLSVNVIDLPRVAFANRIKDNEPTNTYDLLHFEKAEDHLETAKMAEFVMPEMPSIDEMDEEIDPELEEQMEEEVTAAMEAYSAVTLAMDNYHKNYHQILDTFDIDISTLSGFSGVYIEQGTDGACQAVRYSRNEPAVAAPGDLDQASSVSNTKRRRISDMFNPTPKPETKRNKSGDMESRFNSLESRFNSVESRFNSYTGKTEHIDRETATVLYRFANKDDADKAHQKFMQIAFVHADQAAQ